jgi:hypothetical protein
MDRRIIPHPKPGRPDRRPMSPELERLLGELVVRQAAEDLNHSIDDPPALTITLRFWGEHPCQR